MAIPWSSADVPSVVDSLEKAFLQCALALESVASDKEVIVRLEGGSRRSDPVIQLTDFRDANNVRQVLVVAYVPIADDADVTAGKLFSKAQGIANASVSADYKTA